MAWFGVTSLKTGSPGEVALVSGAVRLVGDVMPTGCVATIVAVEAVVGGVSATSLVIFALNAVRSVAIWARRAVSRVVCDRVTAVLSVLIIVCELGDRTVAVLGARVLIVVLSCLKAPASISANCCMLAAGLWIVICPVAAGRAPATCLPGAETTTAHP